MSDALTAMPSEPEWAAFAPIDWADQKNFWRLLPAGSRGPRPENWGIPRKRWRLGRWTYNSGLAVGPLR